MKAFVFPGQGSQYQGMGADLFSRYKDMVQVADEILGYSVAELCLKDPNRQLGFTQFTQPALYVVNALSYLHKINNTGNTPDYLAGHSLGEYNALHAAGSVSFEDGLKLVKKRGELMSRAPKGAMAAILGSTEDTIRHLLTSNGLDALDIANFNSPDQTVVSGLGEDIGKAQSLFDEREIKCIPLNTSGAFHSRYMEPAAVEYGDYLKQFNFTPLMIDVISNVTAKPYKQNEVAANLTSQITHSVKWVESVRYMVDRGVTEFKEIGAGNILTALVDKIQAHIFEEKRENTLDVATLSGDQTADKTQQKSDKLDTLNNSASSSIDNVSAIESADKVVDAWNRIYPIGTKVSAKQHSGELETRTKAVLLFGRKAVIYMKGYKGYFDLEDVKPAIGYS